MQYTYTIKLDVIADSLLEADKIASFRLASDFKLPLPTPWYVWKDGTKKEYKEPPTGHKIVPFRFILLRGEYMPVCQNKHGEWCFWHKKNGWIYAVFNMKFEDFTEEFPF